MRPTLPPRLARKGWLPDLPDHRDRVYRGAAPSAGQQAVDLRAEFPPIYDQGQTSSCTGNALSAALAHLWREGGETLIPSRLFLYWWGRYIESNTEQDAGACIRDVIKGAALIGECAEDDWPFDPVFICSPPAIEAIANARKHLALQYRRIEATLDDMRSVLLAGFPFVMGISVYDSFESGEVARTGWVPLPDLNEENLIGGHAICVVGFDDAKQIFICRNSWGAAWGDAGHFYLPYDYATNPNLADDRWVVTSDG